MSISGSIFEIVFVGLILTAGNEIPNLRVAYNTEKFTDSHYRGILEWKGDQAYAVKFPTPFHTVS